MQRSDPGSGLLGSLCRTAAAAAILPLGLLWYSTTAAIGGALGRTDRKVHESYVGFSRLAMRVAGTRLRVYGEHHAQPGHSYVLVSNHESNWDPLSIVAGLREMILRFVVKQQLLRIPIFGLAVRWTGNVTVERKQSRSDVSRIHAGMKARHEGVSMLFFAEGTRSRSGRMQPFKKGAIATALTHQLAILPVGIAGTRAVWPPGFSLIRRGSVVIEVGEPIPVEGLGLDDRNDLRDQAEQAVRKLRSRAHQRRIEEGWPAPPDLD